MSPSLGNSSALRLSQHVCLCVWGAWLGSASLGAALADLRVELRRVHLPALGIRPSWTLSPPLLLTLNYKTQVLNFLA